MTPFKVVLTNVTQQLYTLRQETVLVFGDRVAMIILETQVSYSKRICRDRS